MIQATGLTYIAYILAALLFILALAGLSKQETAKMGCYSGIAGMAIALIATFTKLTAAAIGLTIFAMVIGACVGLFVARKVQMTQMPELIACLRAITRRGDGAPVMALSYGGVSLSEKDARLSCDATSQSVKLGAKEYQLLEVFLRNPRQIMGKDLLTDRVWGYDSEAEYNNLEVYISFVRKKLTFVGSGVKIKTTRGLGYSLEEGS